MAARGHLASVLVVVSVVMACCQTRCLRLCCCQSPNPSGLAIHPLRRH
jgi:hypothetical protein